MTYHYLVSDVDVPVMTDFPFGHLVAAANHSVNTKNLVWRPPNETPMKGQEILFEGLPFDILFEVTKHLGYQGILRLGATNRFFHKILDPRKALSAMEIAEFVQERDKADKNKFSDNFACYGCYRFRPREKFARKMIKTAPDRYCLDCAADMRWYGHMQCVSNGKVKYRLCHNCGTYGTESTICKGKKNAGMELCTPKVVVQPSKLETLPTHLLRNITAFLGYRDVLKLARTNRMMNEKIQLDWVPMHDRFRCMNERWTTDRTDFGALKAFPCFMCFQYKPRKKFTKTQLDNAYLHPETSWKLRCQSCLQKMYSSYKHPVRKEYRRRRMCEICKCIKHGGNKCGGCMELYVNGVIDRDVMFPRRARVEFDYQEYLNGLDGVFVDEKIEEPVVEEEEVKHEVALDGLSLGDRVEDIFRDVFHEENICVKATRLVMGVGWFG